jgi:hypothetical protein
LVDSVTEGWLHTDVDTTLLDHGTVSLIDGTGDLLEVVRVGDQLVAGEDVLLLRGSVKKDHAKVQRGVVVFASRRRGIPHCGGRDRVTGVAYLEDNHGDGWVGFERMDLKGERS